MDSIEILPGMNTEQNPLHWTKKNQNDAIDEAVAAIEKQYRPNKVIIRELGQRYCPVCGNNGTDYMYCRDCDQKLSRKNKSFINREF